MDRDNLHMVVGVRWWENDDDLKVDGGLKGDAVMMDTDCKKQLGTGGVGRSAVARMWIALVSPSSVLDLCRSLSGVQGHREDRPQRGVRIST